MPPVVASSCLGHDSNAKPSRSETSFDFLALPTELRLMVYERLPRTINLIKDESQGVREPVVYLVKKSVPVAIVQTCRFVRDEADAIVQRIMEDFIGPARILVGLEEEDLDECTYDDLRDYYDEPSTCRDALRRGFNNISGGRDFLLQHTKRFPSHPAIEIGLFSTRSLRLHKMLTNLPFLWALLAVEWDDIYETQDGTKINLTIAIAGVRPSNKDDYTRSLKLPRTAMEHFVGIDRIVGFPDTPPVDWDRDWGVSNFEDLDWSRSPKELCGVCHGHHRSVIRHVGGSNSTSRNRQAPL